MIGSYFYFGNRESPILALAIHNGHKLPAELLPGCGIDESTRLREEDPFTGEFAELFSNHIILDTSRFAIDLNRSPEKAVYLKPEDAWGLPVRSFEPVPELLTKLHKAYDNWYKLLQYQLERLTKIQPLLLVLDLHSYNHRRGGPAAEPDPQSKNPDIIIGRSNLESKHYHLPEKLCSLLDGQDFLDGKLDCRCDVKFTGGYLSRWINSHYPDNAICISIEFKKIFMNEWTGELNITAFEELKRIFLAAVHALYPY
ncbi:MAG: N-formylglutamate amidohydrolase [Candidatus Cloacimonas sp.]|jgi:N-formylglutamate amidohydrolase|nr:N-formylglutamate amidohydrolase [Candidatus Cloacimonas sp.]